MKHALPLLTLLAGIGCGTPPDVTKTPVTYVGVWRAGTSKADYMVFELYKDNSVKFFGSKHDIMAPVSLTGDGMIVKPDAKSTPPETGTQYQMHLKRISESKIEITDDSGTILGVTTPVSFEKITGSQEEETSSQIMSRAMNGG